MLLHATPTANRCLTTHALAAERIEFVVENT
jgi:hypothetical protein